MTVPAPRVLVAYATKRGTTADIAGEIGEALADAGVEVDVRAAAEVGDVSAYDAVVLGSAIYMGRWRRAARAFARRHAHALRGMPVWLYSSGPLDDGSRNGAPRAPLHAERIAATLDAREHVIFGGALAAHARGFVTHRMVQAGLAGDYRDHEEIRSWARRVAEAVLALQPRG